MGSGCELGRLSIGRMGSVIDLGVVQFCMKSSVESFFSMESSEGACLLEIDGWA